MPNRFYMITNVRQSCADEWIKKARFSISILLSMTKHERLVNGEWINFLTSVGKKN